MTKHYRSTYILPPSSLICHVTTNVPFQTRAKTPEKTTSFWLEEAVIDNSRLKSKENTRGPLNIEDEQWYSQ